MSTTHRVKMAKASQEDLEAGFALNRAFDFLSYGYEPTASDDDENEQRFDIDDHGSCRRVLEHLLAIARRGRLMRLVMGLQVLLDPRNEVVDPNLPHLELHPKHEQAARERDAARAEIERLAKQRDAAMQRATDENAALFKRNGDVARIGKQLDELVALAVAACRLYASKKGRVIPEMERLGSWLEKHIAAEQPKPADDGAEAPAGGGG